MAHYRLYFLGPDGRIALAFDLECKDDEAAISEARTRTADGFELWRGDRLVFSRQRGEQ